MPSHLGLLIVLRLPDMSGPSLPAPPPPDKCWQCSILWLCSSSHCWWLLMMILIRWRDYEDKDGQIERSAQGKQSRAHPELISPQIKQSSPARDPGINEKLSSPTVANIRLISQEEYFKYFFMIRFDISMICPPRTSQPLSTVFIKWRAKCLTLTLKYCNRTTHSNVPLCH